MEGNIKKHNGNTELYIQVTDEETGFAAVLRTQNQKMEINDELLQFLEAREEIKYIIDKV
jgi:hypothetical protein